MLIALDDGFLELVIARWVGSATVTLGHSDPAGDMTAALTGLRIRAVLDGGHLTKAG